MSAQGSETLGKKCEKKLFATLKGSERLAFSCGARLALKPKEQDQDYLRSTLSRRRDFIPPSPHLASHETRSRRSGPTSCWAALLTSN